MNTLQQIIATVERLQNDISLLKKENLHLTAKLKQATEIADTRSENFPPSYYRKKGVGVYREFKHIDIYPEIKDHSNWLYVETIVQWGDTTGGGIKQVIYSENNIYYRVGKIDDTKWENIYVYVKE